jgi:hypothetical protein
MEDWISKNWLALYGSIVGTIALIINLSKFIHSLKKDKVKLSLSVAPHPDREANIQRFKDTEQAQPWEQANLVEVYVITVRNKGTVVAFIEDATLICKKGSTYQALTRYSGDNCMLGSIPQVGTIKVEPKSSVKLSIYQKREHKDFTPKRVEVIDSTGKKWRKNA